MVESESLVIGIIGIIIGFFTSLLSQYAWEQYIKPIFFSESQVKLHSKVKVYKRREDVAELLCDVVRNSRSGETLFGHCKSCGEYPEEFFEELKSAKERGVNVMALITKTDESEDFIKEMLELGKDANQYGAKWEVRGLKGEGIKIRVFGYINKTSEKRGEIIVAFKFMTAYMGLHFKDPKMVEYIWPSFQEKWRKGIPLNL